MAEIETAPSKLPGRKFKPCPAGDGRPQLEKKRGTGQGAVEAPTSSKTGFTWFCHGFAMVLPGVLPCFTADKSESTL